MPDMIIIAGPNGAGKSTFGNELRTKLPIELVYFNADLIEAELKRNTPGQRWTVERRSRSVGEDRSRDWCQGKRHA